MTLTLLLGAVVGLILGLTGAGGGILAVPLLVFGQQLTITEAGPIGLLAVGISAAVGAVIGLRSGIVRYRAALLVAGTGILLAPAGIWLAQGLNTRILSVVFAIVLLWVAFKSFKESRENAQIKPLNIVPPCIRESKSGRFIWTNKCAALLAATGSVAGVLSGLLGVGGGFVMVPALQRYTDLEMRSVVATSLAVIALISITGVATSISSGHFDHAIGVPFAAGTVAGMVVGGALSSRLSTKYLKKIFALICLAVAVGMIVKAS